MIKYLASLTISVFCASVALAGPVKPVIPPKAEPFSLYDVHLLDGPFKKSFDDQVKHLREYDMDRLLATFRREAGLQPKGEFYGGWEVNLEGVGVSFYLSGASRIYAQTGDQRFLKDIKYILTELEECQDARNGLLAATHNSNRFFSQIESGQIDSDGIGYINGEFEPYYSMEKLFSGLRDAYRIAGQKKALDIEIKLAKWLEDHMSHLNDDQMQAVMSCEFGGMNWLLSDLYVDTGDPRYMAMSKRWQHKAIIDPLILGQDQLDGKHANTQFPKISGLAARYPYSGDQSDRIAAQFFWDRVVNHHSYVTGGNSIAEHFGLPDKLNDRLGWDTTELCNTYNMLRLTNLLFAIEPSAQYADFMERALYNHVLAAQHPDDSRVCYFFPLKSGCAVAYLPEYQGDFACCMCSSFDSYTRFGEYIYFHSSDELYVNQYIASELNWKQKNVSVKLLTGLPDKGASHLTFTCQKPVRFKLSLRCPAWATDGTTVTINKQKQPVSTEPGSYIVIDRTWRSGDVVDVTTPEKLHIQAMPDNANRAAILYGPLVLAADVGEIGQQSGRDAIPCPTFSAKAVNEPLERWIKPVPGKASTFKTVGVGMPNDVELIPLFRLRDRRLSVYWDFVAN